MTTPRTDGFTLAASSEILVALVATGATFTPMTGYVTGRLADDDGADELLRTAEQSIPVAHRLGNRVLNLHGTGLDNRGCPPGPRTRSPGPNGSRAGRP